VREYAEQLLGDAPDLTREREREHGAYEDEGGLTGCREAVEILTRNPKKGASLALAARRRGR
jgi:hypothetical protein